MTSWWWTFSFESSCLCLWFQPVQQQRLPHSVHDDRLQRHFWAMCIQKNDLVCHWVAGAKAFESHLMFARLQGSPRRSCVMSRVMSEQRWRRQEEGRWRMRPVRNVWKPLTSASVPLGVKTLGSECDTWNASYISYVLSYMDVHVGGGWSYVWQMAASSALWFACVRFITGFWWGLLDDPYHSFPCVYAAVLYIRQANSVCAQSALCRTFALHWNTNLYIERIQEMRHLDDGCLIELIKKEGRISDA